MSPATQPAPPSRHHARSSVLAILVILAMLGGALGCRSLAEASASAPPGVAEPAAQPPQERLRSGPGDRQGSSGGASGVADGRLPDWVTAFHDTYPAVANLDPD